MKEKHVSVNGTEAHLITQWNKGTLEPKDLVTNFCNSDTHYREALHKYKEQGGTNLEIYPIARNIHGDIIPGMSSLGRLNDGDISEFWVIYEEVGGSLEFDDVL